MLRIISVVTLGFALVGALYAFSKKPTSGTARQSAYYLVKLKKDIKTDKLAEVFSPYEIQNVVPVGSSGLVRIKFHDDPGIKELQNLIKQKGALGIIEPDHKVLMTDPMQNETKEQEHK